MMKAVLLLSCIVVAVMGHGWLNVPQPRGWAGDNQGSANTTGPCGNSGSWIPISAENWSPITVQWQNGGGHGAASASYCYFSFSPDMNTFADNTMMIVGNCGQGSYTQNLTVFWPDLVDTAVTGYLQFNWRAGDGSKWYNCAQLTINPSSIVMNQITVGSPNVMTISGETDYFRAVSLPGTSMLVQATGPAAGGIDIYIKKTTLPSPTYYDSHITLTAGQTFLGSFCGSSDNTNSSSYIIVVPFGNSNGSSYSFTASSYSGLIDIIQPAPQVTDTLPSQGYKAYYTKAYSTAEVPKRVVVKSDSTVSLTYGLTCDASIPPVATASGTLCTALGTQANANKYIIVSTSGTASYSVSVEKGTCAELGSASTMSFSAFVLVALVFIATLF